MATNNTTTIYKIENPDFNEYFELHVSKTKKIMESHIKSYSKKEKICMDEEYFGDALGLTISGFFEPQERPFAYVFFNEENLNFGIINHEIVHVGMAHERYVLHFKMNYGDENDESASIENEERLAYYVAFVSNAIYKKLIENKHIKILNYKSLLTKE